MEKLAMKDFWKSKKVLITGHSGFKGSWLSFWLNQMGAEIAGLSIDSNERESLYHLISKDIYSLGEAELDIRDNDALVQYVKKIKPEIIFHLAAQPIVRESYMRPRETFETNVMGTINILEAVRLCGGVRVLQVITSDKCYENQEWLWSYREIDRLGGRDPYSCSKSCAELVTRSYRESFDFLENFGTSVATTRAGNVIGGGDWGVDRLIPDVVNAITQGSELVLRNPKSIRPWQHVLDLLRGYLELARNQYNFPELFSDSWNFGPKSGSARTVEYLVGLCFKRWEIPPIWRVEKQKNFHENNLLMLDTAKTQRNVDWVPVFDLEEAVDWTIDWYKNWSSGSNMLDFSEDQLRKYEEICVS